MNFQRITMHDENNQPSSGSYPPAPESTRPQQFLNQSPDVIQKQKQFSNHSPDDYIFSFNESLSAAPYEFLQNYFSMLRFTSETTLAGVSGLFNAVALFSLVRSYGHANTPTKAVYKCLFLNLSLANLLTCIFQWFCNNVLFFFEEPLFNLAESNPCLMLLYMASAFFVSTSFGLVSSLTMLGFATVQYLAICKPLRSIALVSTTKVVALIAVSWVVSLLCGCVPFSIFILVVQQAGTCTSDLREAIASAIIFGINISVCLVAIIYTAVVCFCIRIYIEVRQLQLRLLQFSRENEIKHEKKAFVTTVILLSTLIFFFLPHTILYLITCNSSLLADSSLLMNYMICCPTWSSSQTPSSTECAWEDPNSSSARSQRTKQCCCCCCPCCCCCCGPPARFNRQAAESTSWFAHHGILSSNTEAPSTNACSTAITCNRRYMPPSTHLVSSSFNGIQMATLESKVDQMLWGNKSNNIDQFGQWMAVSGLARARDGTIIYYFIHFLFY